MSALLWETGGSGACQSGGTRLLTGIKVVTFCAGLSKPLLGSEGLHSIQHTAEKRIPGTIPPV